MTDDTDDDELLTYPQAAKFLNIRLGTLYSLVSRKEIPHVRLGRRLVRFSRSALVSLIAERSITGGLGVATPMRERGH